MLRAVIFDIDDTLYSFADANRTAMEVIGSYAEAELGVPAQQFRDETWQAWKEQERSNGLTAGCHSRTIRFQMILERRGLPLRYAPLMSDLYWNTMLEVIRPFEGVPEALRELNRQGLVLGIATDMTADWQIRKLERLGILEQLDFVVTSEEAGVEKPDRRVFQLCAAKAGCPVENCLMVGDNLKKDVLGAQAAGMQAVWFQPDTEKAAMETIVKSIPTFKGLIDHIKSISKEKDL